jgi:hypothetical protein
VVSFFRKTTVAELLDHPAGVATTE